MMLTLKIIGLATLAFFATAFCSGCLLLAVLATKITFEILRDKSSLEGDQS